MYSNRSATCIHIVMEQSLPYLLAVIETSNIIGHFLHLFYSALCGNYIMYMLKVFDFSVCNETYIECINTSYLQLLEPSREHFNLLGGKISQNTRKKQRGTRRVPTPDLSKLASGRM